MGMRVCGVSCVANLAAGITGQPLTHEEVMIAANEAAPSFTSFWLNLFPDVR
jgi:purine-nucleoside phosphorylase